MLHGVTSRYLRSILLVLLLSVVLAPITLAVEQACGDINGDGTTNDLGDLIYYVNYLFLGGPMPVCAHMSDCNRDGTTDMSDLIYLVNYLMLGGPAPVCPEIVSTAASGYCISGGKSGLTGDKRVSASQSECVAEMGDDSTEYMYADIVGDDLYVYHFNAFYNCCMMYAVTVSFEAIPGGYHVSVQEADTTSNPCYCMCYFDLEAVVPLAEITEPTVYVVELVHADGHTVGIDTVAIGGEESMYVDVVGNDLYIHHRNAYMNCCPAFYTTFEFDGDVIRAYEADSLDACDCYCLYNLRSILYDVYPGTWTVELYGVWPRGVLVGVDTVVVPPPR